MADIRQAAKWMAEGKRVRRYGWIGRVVGTMSSKAQTVYSFCTVRGIILSVRPMKVSDLLAEDWEVAE